MRENPPIRMFVWKCAQLSMPMVVVCGVSIRTLQRKICIDDAKQKAIPGDAPNPSETSGSMTQELL